MAMKKKSQDTALSVTLNSEALAPKIAIYQRKRLASLISDAMKKPARALENRCNAFSPKVKGKRKPKEKVRKETVKQEKVIPVPPPKAQPKTKTITDDSERYAMWWDMVDDRTLRMKTMPIDSPPSVQVKCKRAQRASKDSKNAIKNLKAYGIPTRTDLPWDKAVAPWVPHQSSSEFGEVLANNKGYLRELVRRYQVSMSIVRMLTVSVASTSPFKQLDYLSTTTVDPYKPIVSEQDVLEDQISNLEKHISNSITGPIVMARDSAPHEDYQPGHWQAVAEAFDMDLSEVLPSAANAPAWEDSEAQYEQDQWSIKEERTPLQRMQDNGKAPWYGDTDMEECRRLYKLECEEKKEYFDLHGVTKAQHELDGTRYLRWLMKHKSSLYLHERYDLSLKAVNPEHVMDRGQQVHIMYHSGDAAFDNIIKYQQYRRISMFDMGILGNEPFIQWYNRTESNEISPLADEARAEALAWASKVTDQASNEALAEKIVDNVIAKQRGESQLSFVQWRYMIESQYVAQLPPVATVCEDSPTPEVKGAEVVNLSVVRNERSDGVSKIMAIIKPKLEGLTEEQKEGARLVINALSEAIG